MGDWEVRRAEARDEAAVLGLVERLVAFGPPPWREPEALIEVDRRKIKAALHSTGADPLVMVAVEGDAVVGFVHMHSLRDQYRSDHPHGHVSDIVVAPSFEGIGVGRSLLKAAEAWAVEQGFDWLTISVFEENRRAATMYERAGFGRDILRLVKTIK